MEQDAKTVQDNLGRAPEAPNKDNPPTTGSESDELTKERYKQQLEWSKQEVQKKTAEAQRYKETAINVAVLAAEKDAGTFLELKEKDPELANEVAKRFHYANAEEAAAAIKWNGWESADVSKKWLSEDESKANYQKRRAEEVHTEAIQSAEKQINARFQDDELRDAALQQFRFLAEGRTLTPELAKQLLEMASLYVSNQQAIPWQDTYQEFSSWGWIGTGLPPVAPQTNKQIDYAYKDHFIDTEWNLVDKDGKIVTVV